MSEIKKIGSPTSSVWNIEKPDKEVVKKDLKIDSIEISNTAKVYDKVDKFLNLGAKDRLDFSGLNKEEKKEFLKMVSSLVKNGVVGYEILEVKGKPEKHFLENQIGNERLKGAKLYNKNDIYKIKK